MTTELVPAGIAIPTGYNESEFKSISGSTFLPRLTLCGGNSDLCKTGKVGMGNWAIVSGKDTAIDLGKSVLALVLSWRAKAVDMNDPIVSSFDMKSASFKAIQAKSAVADSKCMFGPEFLLWVPGHKFCTYHAASKTARNTAGSILQIMKDEKILALGSALIVGKKFSWHGATVTMSATPLPEYPDVEEANSQISLFSNPAESKIEVAPETGDTREI